MHIVTYKPVLKSHCATTTVRIDMSKVGRKESRPRGVKYYKVVRADGGTTQGYAYAGFWVKDKWVHHPRTDELDLCHQGLHFTPRRGIMKWLAEDCYLWEAEVKGVSSHSHRDKVVCRSGRIVNRLGKLTLDALQLSIAKALIEIKGDYDEDERDRLIYCKLASELCKEVQDPRSSSLDRLDNERYSLGTDEMINKLLGIPGNSETFGTHSSDCENMVENVANYYSSFEDLKDDVADSTPLDDNDHANIINALLYVLPMTPSKRKSHAQAVAKHAEDIIKYEEKRIIDKQLEGFNFSHWIVVAKEKQ